MSRSNDKTRRGSRRNALGLLAAGVVALGAAVAMPSGPAAAQASPQQIADHFASVSSMHGDFVQFNADGSQSEGKFYIERPGKVRFDYSNQPLRVISDGSNVAINNRKLNTWETYPLSQTPMKLLLDRRIDLSQANIQDVRQQQGLTTIVMGDSSVFGNSRITMMFDPNSYELKQWTIRDKQGKDTSVNIFNVSTGGDIQNSAFNIPYTAISQGQTGN